MSKCSDFFGQLVYSTKNGYSHDADSSTLFLHEMGNLAMETQLMQLRTIHEKRYPLVGDRADKDFNTRIIAATNEGLEAAVSCLGSGAWKALLPHT